MLGAYKADTAGELDALVEAAAPTLGAVQDRGATWAVAQCRCPPYGVIETIGAFGCTVAHPIVFADGVERYEVLAPDRERVEALMGRLREVGDLTVERAGDVEGSALVAPHGLAPLVAALRPHQLLVLRTAIDAGYDATPRAVSAEALAASLGMSRSTWQEHLRKAERAVLPGFAQQVAEHPDVVTTARKGRGRPAAGVPRARRAPARPARRAA